MNLRETSVLDGMHKEKGVMTSGSATRWGRLLAVSVLFCFSLSFTGCVEEVEDIDRTQANKVVKKDLEGAWLYLQTMVDVPQQSAQGFIGQYNFGSNAKVMFDIQEHYVYMHPVLETVQFSEAKYSKKLIRNYWDDDKSDEFVEVYVGQPLAVFPVESHFDVIRSFNTATGKQSNVLVEDTSENVWHKREYMRVNWGANMLLDWAYPAGTAQFSPVDHYVTEDEDPYLKQNGQGADPDKIEFKTDYLSFVTKAYMPPSGADWQGYSCNSFGVSNKDCAGSVIKVRHSFKRAPATPDYQTAFFPNYEHMDKFGFFRSDRYSYDELWNLTVHGTDYKAQRFNLWQTTWNYEDIKDENGNLTACMNHTDCGEDKIVLDEETIRCVQESRFAPGKCAKATLKPHKTRGLQPVVYHLSSVIEENLRNDFYHSAVEWSEAFKDVVAWLYALEDNNQYWTRSCSTNADCTNGREDVLHDGEYDLPVLVANTDEATCPKDPGYGFVNGKCVQSVACSAEKPCSSSQICADGVCFERNEDGSKSNKQILVDVTTKGFAATTGVLYRDKEGGVGVIFSQDDNEHLTKMKAPDGSSDKQLDPATCAIRFVHASPTAGKATVKVGRMANGSPEWLSDINAEFEFNADAVVNQAWKVAANANAVISVTADGNTTTQEYALNAGWNYTVAFVGGDAIVAGGSKVGSTGSGVRFLHGIKDEGAVDVGLTSVRAGAALQFGELSGYSRSAFDKQRVTVIVSGNEGDVTCYHHMHEGRCVGWASANNTKVQEAYQKYMETLPEMFVVCENIYEAGNAAEAKFEEAQKNPGVLHDGRYMTRGTNPYNLADQQALEDPNALFNPCEHFVADPYELKKIGDIRYKYLYWIGENQASSPLGYGPSAGDPETGETIWATAYVYGAPMRTYGQFATDIINVINGKYSTDDIITGKYVKDFIERKGDSLPMDNSSGLYYSSLKIPEAIDLQHQLDLHPQFSKEGYLGKASDPFKSDMMQVVSKFATDENYRKKLLRGLPTVKKGYTQNRMNRIKGTHIEDLMVNNEVRMGMSGGKLLPGEELDQDAFDQLSPLKWATSAAQLERRETRRMLAAHAPCSFDREFMDDNIYGLAQEFACNEEEQKQYDAGTLEGKKCLSGDALRWEITSKIFGGVMEHEIGHTVGLRHNFAGSVDIVNFKDEYFGIREKQLIYCQDHSWCDDAVGEQCSHDNACAGDGDCKPGLTCDTTEGKCVDQNGLATGVCQGDVTDENGNTTKQDVKKYLPRPFQTASEAANKMTEYQYSTVMDYGGRFNSDIHGLGKYDKAAIRFGYANLVDVFNNTDKLRNRINTLATTYGFAPSRYSYMLNTQSWRYAGILTSAFAYVQDYIGVNENLDRRAVPYEKVKLEHQMQNNYDDEEVNWTFIEVPYRFCSDEYRGSLNCYYFDTGADIGEIINNAVSQVDEYYVWDAFKRERMYMGSDRFINYYFGRILDRFLAPLGDTGRYWAIYDHIFREYGNSWIEWSNNVLGPRTLKETAKRSFNHLAQMLAAPAPGSYKKDPGDRVYRNITYDLDAQGTDLTIPVGVGKFPHSQWMQSENYGYFNHVVWVGSFWLKLGALMTLTDSTFYSSADWVGEQLEIGRSSAVGFSTLYQRELTNIIGGIVAESLDHYSGVVETDASGAPTFKGRDLFNFKKDEGKDVVEPGLNNLSLKLYSAVMGLANIPAGFDPSFIDSMAVYLKGSGQEYDLIGSGGGVQKAEFNDPFGAKTYVAYTPNYDVGRLPAAYKIVESASTLRQQWDKAQGLEKDKLAEQLKTKIQMLDILRELHVLLGTLDY